MDPAHKKSSTGSSRYNACRLAACLLALLIPSTASPSTELTPFSASPDQVLVIYNADWNKKSEGTAADQDSREVAEYYVKMHTDQKTGKKPRILGLSCVHFGKKHLNDWVIGEESNDNGNGVIFKGKGPAPSDSGWIRDSRKVEISVTDPRADWNSVSIKCKSLLTGEETIVTPLRTGFKVSGVPSAIGDETSYPPIEEGKGRCYRFDASKLFAGPVTVFFTVKNREGKVIRDLSLRYSDIRDFAFSPTGADGIPDDKNLEEDVLTPVRRFLEDPANALPDGTLLKNHILYIVLVHGMPYSAKGVFGIDHGATANRGDHGSFTSLEQRLQTLYYGWKSIRVPVISFYMAAGPDADNGVANYIITSGMRNQLGGTRWNPFMHPDTYSSLKSSKNGPTFHKLPPFPTQRKEPATSFFAYGVTRLDGANPDEAKRVIDYSIYATKYLRPEMDCRVRAALAQQGKKMIPDLAERLKRAEDQNLWGEKEIESLGFIPTSPSWDQGLPFLARPGSDPAGNCLTEKADWAANGFYPGGMERKITSANGWNFKNSEIWQQVRQGVTVSAAGAPAYSGGPHITNATFWDHGILQKYLLRGRDLGECFLRATWYVNWSTSLLGDPLFHPDLHKTIMDSSTPTASKGLEVTFEADRKTFTAAVSTELDSTPENPKVAILKIVCKDQSGKENSALSALYSRRPRVVLKDLQQDTDYTITAELIDPYGNRTTLPAVTKRTGSINYPLSVIKDFLKSIEIK